MEDQRQLEASEEAGEPQRFGRFAAEFGLRQYAAFHDWARWALARVESADDLGRGHRE